MEQKNMYRRQLPLREFIRRLSNGDDWANGGTPMMLGGYLASLPWSAEQLSTTVDVHYRAQHSGWAYSSSSTYLWKVTGVTLPQAGAVSLRGPAEAVFGGRSPMTEPVEGGFVLSHRAP